MADPTSTRSGYLDQFAFVWDQKFYEQHFESYLVEKNSIAVEETESDLSTRLLTTNEIVENFLCYKCQGDRDRYHSRDSKIKRFLRGADINSVRTGNLVGKARVLLDLRVSGVTPQLPRDGHSVQAPLTVQQFYHSNLQAKV